QQRCPQAPQAQQQQKKRTNDVLQTADIFTRYGQGELLHRGHCTVILASAITLPQSAASSAKKRAASARVEPIGSIFISSRRFRTSGRRKISAISRLMRSASASGVPGGATSPNQVIEG